MTLSQIIKAFILCNLVLQINGFIIRNPIPSAVSNTRRTVAVGAGYVPSGLSPEEWDKIKKKEGAKRTDLGKGGPRGYRSRSFQSFQEALENGDPSAKNMPVFNAKEKLKKGELKLSDIPYMQRGGSWDNSDIKGAQKAKWTSADKQYDPKGSKDTKGDQKPGPFNFFKKKKP